MSMFHSIWSKGNDMTSKSFAFGAAASIFCMSVLLANMQVFGDDIPWIDISGHTGRSAVASGASEGVALDARLWDFGVPAFVPATLEARLGDHEESAGIRLNSFMPDFLMLIR